MDKLKLNDENRYIYGMVQKIPTATPLENFQRDTAAENQFYKITEAFPRNTPRHPDGWKLMNKIFMGDPAYGTAYMLYHFEKNHKTALVTATYKTEKSLVYQRPDMPMFLYQGKPLQGRPFIFFTDNILWAESISRSAFSRESLWIATSFLDTFAIDKLDFSIFKNKTVVYGLFERPGLPWANACDRAVKIINKFPESTQVYIMTCPMHDMLSPFDPAYNVFLSSRKHLEDEIRKLQSAPQPQESQIAEVNWMVPPNISRREIAEGIWEKTITWLYGASRRDRTLYLTHFAASLSQGKTNIQAHKVPERQKVAYIYINPESDDFLSGLQDSVKNITGRDFGELPLTASPATVLEAEELLWKVNFFCCYPVSNEPVLKISSNILYSLFFPAATSTANAAAVMPQLLQRVVDNLGRYHSDVKLIILDIPLLWKSGIRQAEMEPILYSLRSQYAVILSTNDTAEQFVSDLPWDSIIRMRRRHSTPESISIDLIFERDDRRKEEKIERLTKGANDKQWKIRVPKKLSVKQKMEYVVKHRDDKIREVAKTLGISESYVKKLRGLAEVSKKVPGRAPQKNKHKPVEYSIPQ